MQFIEEIRSALLTAGATPLQRDIVRELAREPQGAAMLARRFGLSHHVQVNAALGTLGRHVRRELSAHPDGLADGEDEWWHVFATGEKNQKRWTWTLRPEVRAAAFEIGWLERHEFMGPEEVQDVRSAPEGAVRTILVNRFERDPDLRQACIQYYGARCVVCSIDMGGAYGDHAMGFVHVHHLVSLAEMQGACDVDPIRDLRPLCPNCHAVAHLRKPPFTIEQLRAMRAKAGTAVEPGVATDGAARRR